MKEIAVFDVVSLRENAVGRFFTARETLKYVRSSSRQRFRRHGRKTGNTSEVRLPATGHGKRVIWSSFSPAAVKAPFLLV